MIADLKRNELTTELKEQIIKEKHNQILSILRETGLDCWLIFVRETSAMKDPSFDLVVGSDVVWESAFIFYSKDKLSFKKTAIVGTLDAETFIESNLWDEVLHYNKGIEETLKTYFSGIKPNTIAINYADDNVMADGLTFGMYRKLCHYLPMKSKLFKSSEQILNLLRGRKTKTELKLIEEACILTEEINIVISSKLKIGMSEIQVQKMFHEEVEKNKVGFAWQKDHNPAVDAGPDKNFGHVGPQSDNYTKPGHTLHNDFGVKKYGYCSDLQRMWFFGSKKEIPIELQNAFETVRDAIYKAAQHLKPGVTGDYIDTIARNYVKSQGYEEFQHALGHQVGRNAHDGGVLLGPLWEKYGNAPKGIVEENNVFTLELYVKTKNYGMVSLEEDVVITKHGCRFLVPRQESFITIERNF